MMIRIFSQWKKHNWYPYTIFRTFVWKRTIPQWHLSPFWLILWFYIDLYFEEKNGIKIKSNTVSPIWPCQTKEIENVEKTNNSAQKYQKRNLTHTSKFKNNWWLLHQLFLAMVNLSPNFVGRGLIKVKLRIDCLSSWPSNIYTFIYLSWHRISKWFENFSGKIR